jgi:hypothetical protein
MAKGLSISVQIIEGISILFFAIFCAVRGDNQQMDDSQMKSIPSRFIIECEIRVSIEIRGIYPIGSLKDPNESAVLESLTRRQLNLYTGLGASGSSLKHTAA